MEKEDFELHITRKEKSFQCMIIFPNKIDTKQFSNYKKLLKFLKNFFKSSIKFHEAMMLLEKLEGSE